MDSERSRRDFLALMGVGGLVFASGCTRSAPGAAAPSAKPSARDFFFLQLSDTHWGYEGPANPEAALTLKQTVAAINAVETAPDFIVFTGDLTQMTTDAKERRARMTQFREIVSGLKTKKLVFLPGEHDAAADQGEAYRETFGETHQAFEHEGVSFVTLDNVSSVGDDLGEAQLGWLSERVAKADPKSPLVVFAHRPLFDLYPDWEWFTRDGARAVEILSKHPNVTVFYGHIHQDHHRVTGSVTHHAARSLVFPLPSPNSVDKRAPLPWDTASTDHGLGHRAVRLQAPGFGPQLEEKPYQPRRTS